MKLHEILSETDQYVTSDGNSSSMETMYMVQDLLTALNNKGAKQVSTKKFQNVLAKQGYRISEQELIMLIDRSGFATAVNGDQITMKNQIPDEVSGQDTQDLPDVADMASDQAKDQLDQDL